jgi:hypothetical protein
MRQVLTAILPKHEQPLRDQIAALIRRWHADRATVCDQTCTCGLRGTLRDQLAEAIRTTFAHAAAYDGATDGRSVTWEQLADAVLPIVEAALARARASCCEDGDRTYAEMERHLTQRAEQAEAAVQRVRAEQAEADLAKAKVDMDAINRANNVRSSGGDSE